MKFNEKTADMIVCGVIFFIGTLFVVNEPTVTGNVVGPTGSESLGVLFGLIFVMVSGLLFVTIYINRDKGSQKKE